jgi:MYXO-CTERM domain-containing protein
MNAADHGRMQWIACAALTGACSLSPLPEGGVPPEQTIEGGLQVQVLPGGFAKFTDIAGGMARELLDGGFCLPPRQLAAGGGATLELCSTSQCDNGRPGCQVALRVGEVEVTVPDEQSVRMVTELDLHSAIPVVAGGAGLGVASCQFDANLRALRLAARITLDIEPRSGELRTAVGALEPAIEHGGLRLGGCREQRLTAGIDLRATAATALTDGLVAFVEPLLIPGFDALMQRVLPSPLGIQGSVDLDQVMPALAAQPTSAIELRVTPGGYVRAGAEGISLGVLAGINSDADPATRTGAAASEVSRCATGLAVPQLAAWGLARTPRGTFALGESQELRETAAGRSDLLFGVSEAFFDLLGHHLIAAGGGCLEVSATSLPQLRLGSIGLLLPSAAALGDGDTPVRLVARPTAPIDFTIGRGTPGSPHLDLSLPAVTLELQVWHEERYATLFRATVDIAFAFDFALAVTAAGQPAVLPTLSRVHTGDVLVTARDQTLLREDAATLQHLVRRLVQVAIPQLLGGLEALPLPSFGGFNLTQLAIDSLTTAEGNFLTVRATLGSSAMTRALAAAFPGLAGKLSALPAEQAIPVRSHITLLAVQTPPAEAIRAHALAGPGRTPTAPQVIVDVSPYDPQGRPVEWTWRADGGMWRPFTRARPLVIAGDTFLLQGHHQIELRSRVVGDYRTLEQMPHRIAVVIDSVPPRIYVERSRLQGDRVQLHATDLVSAPEHITFAFAPQGKRRPTTPWGPAQLDLSTARALAAQSPTGGLAIWARDEAGNEGDAILGADQLATLTTTTAAAGCSTGADRNAAWPAALLLAGMLVTRRRRRAARR